MSISIRHPDDNERRYLFTRQMIFNANENLAIERSNNFIISKPVLEYNIWKKPPDFSVRLYKSLNLLRCSEENDMKKRKDINPILKNNGMEVIRYTPPPSVKKSKEPKRFHTRFKTMEPFEANILYVTNGIYPKDKYKDLRPHDFRQYKTDIPDFVTNYSRDPFNLKFKAQGLSSSCELPPIEVKKSRGKVKRFILHKPADPKWDSGLILPQSPWPNKSASYTRYRRRRGAYSAFMDRVEEKFIASNQVKIKNKEEILKKGSK